MLNDYCAELYEEFEIAMEAIRSSLKPEPEKLTEYIFCIRHFLQTLDDHVSRHEFTDERQEINYYKYIYPRFYSWYIYQVDLYHILKVVPVGPDVVVRDYYLNELSFIQRHFTQSGFLYEYYLQDETAKDQAYFLRKNYSSVFSDQLQDPGIGPGQQTNQGYQFAKIIAYERLRSFLIRRVKLLYQNPDNPYIQQLLAGKKRQWDGDKVELIEIAYGIYFTRRINGGKAELGDIIEWLEDSLQVDLSQAYHIFLEIRRRKTISYTRYLEEMIKAIHDHINDSFRLKTKNSKHSHP